ncbi:diaminopimelate decarboxylase [Brevibacterium sp. 91QC2O2]|jgi:diaminopimelate decarboxylase|uniref:diaminopimelate decarboxylase n=1 Tax=Brevibacterium TaxID=1696 RepID=UPI00211C464E|nr:MULTISPECIES: diaminopimelate decarboxylase [unclassified Brevibacterium]MCQ9368286.1 diaminopimelate decarboxylase [Brevibacterium sp. 91QC2O2]MCQ9384788.1 diaminopimelate decarboxylase [Brevibacterium sp. 68QC2CO]
MPAHISGVMHAGPSPVWLPYPDDVNALMPSLWSRHAVKGADGVLRIAGHRVDELAAQYGSPLYLLDIEDLQERARGFVADFAAAFAAIGTSARSYYAGKALLTTKIAGWVAESGMGIDCCSYGELLTARAAGVDPAGVGLHGNNKSDAEIALALDWGIGRIVVDSLAEIDRVDRLAAARGVRARVMVRVTVGVEAHTHDFIATAHEDQKFGLSLTTGAAHEAAARIVAAANLELLGFHSHIGSQIFDKAGFEIAAARIAQLRAEVQSTHGVGVPEIDLGGGFGMRYTSQDTPIPTAQMAEQLAAVISRVCAEAQTDLPVVSFEPGRSIIGPAVCTLYTVGTVKPVTTDTGIRTYVSVDGGMSDNVRTALYDADYSCTLASRASAAQPVVVRVVGKHCESGDIVVRDEYLPADVRAGDLVAVPGTGAYCRPLASNYNMALRPGILGVAPDGVQWVLEPETYVQLFAADPGMRNAIHDN